MWQWRIELDVSFKKKNSLYQYICSSDNPVLFKELWAFFSPFSNEILMSIMWINSLARFEKIQRNTVVGTSKPFWMKSQAI